MQKALYPGDREGNIVKEPDEATIWRSVYADSVDAKKNDGVLYNPEIHGTKNLRCGDQSCALTHEAEVTFRHNISSHGGAVIRKNCFASLDKEAHSPLCTALYEDLEFKGKASISVAEAAKRKFSIIIGLGFNVGKVGWGTYDRRSIKRSYDGQYRTKHAHASMRGGTFGTFLKKVQQVKNYGLEVYQKAQVAHVGDIRPLSNVLIGDDPDKQNKLINFMIDPRSIKKEWVLSSKNILRGFPRVVTIKSSQSEFKNINDGSNTVIAQSHLMQGLVKEFQGVVLNPDSGGVLNLRNVVRFATPELRAEFLKFNMQKIVAPPEINKTNLREAFHRFNAGKTASFELTWDIRFAEQFLPPENAHAINFAPKDPQQSLFVG